MKKILCLKFFIFLIAILLTSCSNNMAIYAYSKFNIATQTISLSSDSQNFAYIIKQRKKTFLIVRSLKSGKIIFKFDASYRLQKHDDKNLVNSAFIHYNIKFSSNNRYIICLGYVSGTTVPDVAFIKVWSFLKGELLFYKDLNSANIYSFDISNNNKFIAYSYGRKPKIEIISMVNGQLINRFNDGWTNVAFSFDSKFIIYSTKNYKIKMSFVNKTKILKTIKAHKRPIIFIKISPDNKFLITNSISKKLKIWDLATGKMLYAIKSGRLSNRIFKFFKLGEKIIYRYKEKEIHIYSLSKNKVIKKIHEHRNSIFSISLSYKNQYLIINLNNIAKLWNLKTNKLLHIFKGNNIEIDYINFSPDGKYIIVNSFSDNKLEIYRVKDILNYARKKAGQAKALILGGTVNVRAKPTTRSSVVFQTKQNRHITLIQKTGKQQTIGKFNAHWYKIRNQDGRVGYVYGAFLFPLKTLFEKKWQGKTRSGMRLVYNFNKNNAFTLRYNAKTVNGKYRRTGHKLTLNYSGNVTAFIRQIRYLYLHRNYSRGANGEYVLTTRKYKIDAHIRDKYSLLIGK